MNNLALLFRVRMLSLTHMGRIIRRQSRFKTLFVAAFAIGLLAGLWWLFYSSFAFLDQLGGVGLMIIPRLFSFFFLSLVIMLVFSGVLTTYTTLYRSAEIPFLLMHPFSLTEIMLFKSLESAFYASWAFYFVLLPFVGAYAAYEHLPAHISLLAIVFAIPFSFLCAMAGSLITILFIRFIPRSGAFWIAMGLLAFAAAQYWYSRNVPIQRSQEDTLLLINRFVPFLSIASHPLLPSWWLSEGILSVTRGNWTRGGLFLFVLIAHAAALLALIEAIGTRVFYHGWQQALATGAAVRRRPVLFARLERAFAWLPADLRALLFKDVRVFLRDPQQWMQALFFFGLLAIYFLSLRNMQYRNLPPLWKNLITFLNIFSISCVLCSLSSRFIYPQMSLEGQAFWAIGMAPTTMGRILLSKFIAGSSAMLLVSGALMLVSTHMLEVSPGIRAASLVLAACLSCGIAGLSTGHGAIFMDLNERNPSAIVSSFGGTLNLVTTLLFMLACILPVAIYFHYRQLGYLDDAMASFARPALAGLLAALTALATLAPLLAARRSLCLRDY